MKEQHALRQAAAALGRKVRRDAELNPLMDKFDQARKDGLDLNEQDKERLLALLLDDALDGLGNYTSTGEGLK